MQCKYRHCAPTRRRVLVTSRRTERSGHGAIAVHNDPKQYSERVMKEHMQCKRRLEYLTYRLSTGRGPCSLRTRVRRATSVMVSSAVSVWIDTKQAECLRFWNLSSSREDLVLDDTNEVLTESVWSVSCCGKSSLNIEHVLIEQ